GRKKDKARITALLCSNATGSKCLKPLFIGKSNQLRCFKHKSASWLGFYYKNNKKVWMILEIFLD
ncbi:hypothetical protein M427DRAFT_99223, partial [Gonapodya prolifera JEL478]